MRTLIFIFLVALFGCTKVPPPSPMKVAPIKPLTVYDVKVVLKWAQTAPFQTPVLYDSVKAGSWIVNNLGSPNYNINDTALHVTDWFSIYSNDTVTFCLAENGSGWQTAYTGAPPFRKCEEILIVNGVTKMDTILSDMPYTSPITRLKIK